MYKYQVIVEIRYPLLGGKTIREEITLYADDDAQMRRVLADSFGAQLIDAQILTKELCNG